MTVVFDKNVIKLDRTFTQTLSYRHRLNTKYDSLLSSHHHRKVLNRTFTQTIRYSHRLNTKYDSLFSTHYHRKVLNTSPQPEIHPSHLHTTVLHPPIDGLLSIFSCSPKNYLDGNIVDKTNCQKMDGTAGQFLAFQQFISNIILAICEKSCQVKVNMI